MCSALVAAAAAPAAAADQLPTGRSVSPAGQLTSLLAYPTGAAVTPDATTALVIAGAPLVGGTTTSVPGAGTQLEAVDVSTGLVRQSLDVGDAFQSIVISADGATAYVAGASTDAVHAVGLGPGGTLSQPTDLPAGGYVAGLALSGDGRRLWAAEPAANRVVEIDPAGGQILRTVSVPSPDQLAFSADGALLYATNWRGSTVAQITVAGGSVRTLTVGDHPAAIVRSADGRLVVADANDATLATIDPRDDRVMLTSVAQLAQRSDSPNALAAGPDGRIYVSLGGDDAVAVLAPDGATGGWRQLGLIPTAWYPDAVALDPGGHELEVVSAHGLGRSLVATQPLLSADPGSLAVDSAYATAGTLQTLAPPDSGALAQDTAVTRAALTAPAPDPANPIYAGPRGPIKHVIYITRENKTYDADLGDLHPGPDNAFVLFGQPVTPNLHALERTFAEAQSFYYPAYASTTGHMWEDTGMVSDIEDRSNAAGGLNDSWHDPANYPATGLLVGQALRAGRSVRTYNEELAQQSGLFPAADQASTSLYPNYDLAVADASRETGWEQEFSQFESHRCTGSLATVYGARCSLPALEYVYLGGDHTTVVDEPGYPTIQAQVADNDYATGKLIDTVSHSPDWASTLVVVVEDDPQGTGDRASAYHGFMALASPWVKRGYISTVPYNLTSVVGAIDRILGLPALTDYAATNRPLDDLFTSTPNCAPFSLDPSGVQRFPFTALAGARAAADPAHGISSFAEPDRTVPSVTYRATYDELASTRAPGSFADPATFAAANAAAAAQRHDFAACR